MTDTTGVRPLRPGDPRRMGRYELTGRLGEGGMGTVYLATTPEGRRVAVKVIKAELAGDPQFRLRFRTEVARARDVPPFCTAEVLDADPDHEQPYLVVEYVAGPSLATVVTEHGPLTSSNLHGLAIGVATALTAIHGAGVIHRDLKPSNVLLAPGSPKVIDFGIARAVEGAVSHTRTDQMVGTATYMAPERFEPGPGRTVTPAADIFAWGAVIAYAGTGRTPFAAGLPHLVAVRIITMPPDLDGLTGPLRDLVEQALAKDPADRPTARELLDRLLAAGPARGGGAAAVLDRQPALREAVADARAADDEQARERTAEALPSSSPETTRFGQVPVVPGQPSHPPEPAEPSEPADPSDAAPPSDPAPPSPPSGPPPPADLPRSPETPAPPAATAPPAAGAGRRRSGRRLVLACLALVAVAAPAGAYLRHVENRAAAGPGTSASAPPSSAAPSPAPSGVDEIIADPLTTERDWRVALDPAHQASCEFDGALVVTKRSPGPYRCPGTRRPLTDFTASVTARLLSAGACAAVWLRFDRVEGGASPEAGYLLAVCADGYRLMTHGAAGISDLDELAAFPFEEPVPQGTPIAVGVAADGPRLSFTRDGQPVGSWADDRYTRGRMILGVLNVSERRSTARVSFNDVEIRA